MGKKKRVNPHRRPATMADVKRAKEAAVDDATTMAWSIMFTALRDKEGMELEDLKRIWGEINDLSDSIVKGYCTVEDLRDILREEEGIALAEIISTNYGDAQCHEETMRIAADALRERIERNNGSEKSNCWIPVKDRLPEPETDVLVYVERKMVYSNQPVKKCRFVAKAFHEDGTMNTEESLYCWNEMRSRWEYIESEDAYRIPEGWFESVSYEDEFNAVDDFVTHWMPLPQPPKEDKP